MHTFQTPLFSQACLVIRDTHEKVSSIQRTLSLLICVGLFHSAGILVVEDDEQWPFSVSMLGSICLP